MCNHTVASLKNKGQVFFGWANNIAQGGTKADVSKMAGQYPIGRGLDDVAGPEPLKTSTSRGRTRTLTPLHLEATHHQMDSSQSLREDVRKATATTMEEAMEGDTG